MPVQWRPRLRNVVIGVATTSTVLGLALATVVTSGGARANSPVAHPFCGTRAALCSEPLEPWGHNGQYIGHDEPSVLYYSDTAGAGNTNLYRLRLPTDPPIPPNQAGTGGTDNFQLHPAFWFGMAMCDTQSAPNYTDQCAADSDTNIFDSADPTSEHYIGKHPGTAFMEMQFYPPAWTPWPAGVSCDPEKWCAALNIDSFSENQNTGQVNNGACLNSVGIEYVNFAFITKNGKAQAPSNPLDATLATYTPNREQDLFMGSGDLLTVDMHDTSAGFQVVIHDLTTGQTGSMTASIANQFGQIKFDPNSTTCQEIPYAFHPMYSTSSEHTRVPWAAHSYNVAFADEIGHFEYCNAVDPNTGNCTEAGVTEPNGQIDGDDAGCFPASSSLKVHIAGCIASDVDFDGPEYQNNWPGTSTNPEYDRTHHAAPITFSSPLFNGSQNYSRVAFEADLPRIEFATNPPCNRSTGANCVNPPVGASFYPFFSTRQAEASCLWQLGGAFIPGTINTFGGSSTAEYGPLLQLAYPGAGFTPFYRYNNFRQVLDYNPCPAGGR